MEYVFESVLALIGIIITAYLSIKQLRPKSYPKFDSVHFELTPKKPFYNQFIAQRGKYLVYDYIILNIQGSKPEDSIIRIIRNAKMNGVNVNTMKRALKVIKNKKENDTDTDKINGEAYVIYCSLWEFLNHSSEFVEIQEFDTDKKIYRIKIKLDYRDSIPLLVSLEYKGNSKSSWNISWRVTAHGFIS